jgi:hypothetical protein
MRVVGSECSPLPRNPGSIPGPSRVSSGVNLDRNAFSGIDRYWRNSAEDRVGTCDPTVCMPDQLNSRRDRQAQETKIGSILSASWQNGQTRAQNPRSLYPLETDGDIAIVGVSRDLGTTCPMTEIKSCPPLTVRRSCGHRLSFESGQVRSASPTQTAVPRNSAPEPESVP